MTYFFVTIRNPAVARWEFFEDDLDTVWLSGSYACKSAMKKISMIYVNELVAASQSATMLRLRSTGSREVGFDCSFCL